MPWFIVAYLILLVAIGIYSFYDDRKAKVSISYLTIDAAVSVVWIYFVLAYFYPGLAEPILRPLPVVLLLCAVWTVMDVRREMKGIIAKRAASYDPELSPRANLWIDRAVEASGLVFGFLLLTPAFIFAILVVRRTW